ncbi:MAG: hypothetical protein Q9211_000416 [Gyalolechia sp. 1 TL-2023]
MHFTKSLLVGAAAIVAVIAQSSPIAFTSTPASVQAGRSVVLRWGGGDENQPVTITLKRGDSNNLRTVSLITGSATGTSYTWTVPTDLPDGDDYALQINQGVDDVNYSGRFSLSGGSTASSSISSSSTATSALSSASAIIESAINSQSSSVTTTVAAGNATTTLGGALGTGAVGTGAVGTGATGAATGTALIRNTTMSIATLRSTTASTATTTSETATTTGSSEDSSASSTSTGASPNGAMSAASFVSPLVLVVSAIAAIVYLG